MEGFAKCSANFEPLTPLSFLERAANVFRDTTSVIYGEKLKYNWEQTHNRCVKLASALVHLGISHGDVVSFFFFLNSIMYYLSGLYLVLIRLEI